jgi:hypothetical protein
MSFLSKALRRAEVFLEQVDESVTQASRRMVVEGATGDVDTTSDAWLPLTDDLVAAGVLNIDAKQNSDMEEGGMSRRNSGTFSKRRGVANIRRARLSQHTSRAASECSLSDARIPGEYVINDDADEDPSGNGETSTTKPRSEVHCAGDDTATDDADGWEEFEFPGDGDIFKERPATDSATDVSLQLREGLSARDEVSDGWPSEPTTPAAPPVVDRCAAPSASPGTATALPFPASATAASSEAVDGASVLNKPSADTLPISSEPAPASKSSSGSLIHVPSLPITNKKKTAVPDLSASANSASGANPNLAPRRFAVPAAARREASSTTGTRPNASANMSLPLDQAKGDDSGPYVDDEYHTEALLAENKELRLELELAEEDFDGLLKEREKHLKNLKRLKDVVADMDESLAEKSKNARRLEADLVAATDEANKLEWQLKSSKVQGNEALDALRKRLDAEVARQQVENAQVHAENDHLGRENANLKDALTHGREVDMATADGARQQASNAQNAYEQEASAHQETRDMLKTRQEVLETESALAAEAIASAERKATEAAATASNAKAAQRAAEGMLDGLKTARDAALARVEDLNATLAQYKSTEDGLPPGRKELASLQQTVSELENALEAKNVELNRLEGEVCNMRDALKARNDAMASSRSPGSSVVGSGREYSSSHEVEQKLRHMADSALRKQAQIEVLRSENKALTHQLDTERKRTREAQAMAAAATSSRHTLRGGFRGFLDDEERGERGFGMRGEGPIARFRAPRNWPVAFSRFVMSLDKLSAQALGFLRKEPLLRVAILVYICAMHVLVYCMLHHVQTLADSESVISAHRPQPHVPILNAHVVPVAPPVDVHINR